MTEPVPAGVPKGDVSLGDLKLNPGRAVQQYELAFMRAVVAGLADAETGDSIPLAEVRVQLGLS
jgi:hypothetical protein